MATIVLIAVLGIVVFAYAMNVLGVVTSVIGLAILVVLPGAGVARLLIRPRVETIGSSVAVSMGLGLAVAIVIGVALDLTTIGIEHAPTVLKVAAILSAVGLAPTAVGRLLRWKVPTDWIPSASLIALAVVLAAGAYAGAWLAAERQRPAELAQLWILPSGADGIRIGITNVGTSSAEWRLVVQEGGEILAEEEPVDLQPDESWEMTLNVPRRAAPIIASLFGPDDAEPAHRVSLAPRMK